MPIYFFWGEDDFALNQACYQLQEKVIDPHWMQFNYDKISGTQADGLSLALNQAMTPVFGSGERLVWLIDTTICQHCPEDILSQLERTLSQIPISSHLLFTSNKKPDRRLKSTKILAKYTKFQEFSLLPPWKTDEILRKVKQTVQELEVKLTPSAVELLAQSVGNDTRLLYSELNKLKIYHHNASQPIDSQVVSQLVNVTTYNSIQLAQAIRQGKQEEAIALITHLLDLNEHPLRIVATLVGQFRTWTIVKLMLQQKNYDEKAIAGAADLGNPKRVYFLRKEVNSLSSQQLLASLPILFALELNLKKGTNPLSIMTIEITKLCSIFNNTY